MSLYDADFYDDPLKIYVAEVCNVPPLSHTEELICLEHLRAGDQKLESARKRLVEANLHLVVSIAERYRNDRIHILDLVQRGNDALLDALGTFIGSGHTSFSAHAAPLVEHVIAEAATSSNSTDL
jgi:RNA polymerase primary sigma factor